MPILRAGQLVTIPILNDVLYSVLYNATHEQRIGLNVKYQKALKTARKMRGLVTKTTREEKEWLLSYFGYKFFYVIMPNDRSNFNLPEAIEQFKKSHDIKDSLYIHSDEQLVYYLTLYSKSIHHPSYFLNYEITRAGYNISSWPKHNIHRENMEVREICEMDNLLVRTMLSTVIVNQLFPATTGLTPSQIHILLYLYVKRHTYLSLQSLFSFFKGFGPYEKEKYIRIILKSLVNEKYVQKKAYNGTEYTITTLGIKKIADFRDNILNYNNYY